MQILLDQTDLISAVTQYLSTMGVERKVEKIEFTHTRGANKSTEASIKLGAIHASEPCTVSIASEEEQEEATLETEDTEEPTPNSSLESLNIFDTQSS